MDFLPPDFYSIDLLVVPKWGLYANLMAQIISQLSSHFIIFYHRRIVQAAANDEENIPDLVKTDTVLVDDEENEIGQTQPAPVQTLGPVVLQDDPHRLCNHAE